MKLDQTPTMAPAPVRSIEPNHWGWHRCGGRGSIIEGEISAGDCGGSWSPECAQLYVTPTGTPTGGVLQSSVSLQGATTFCCLP